MTRIAGALVVLLCATALAQAQPRGIDGVPLTKVPRILISGQSGDARVPLVQAAVAHWNGILAGMGSGVVGRRVHLPRQPPAWRARRGSYDPQHQ